MRPVDVFENIHSLMLFGSSISNVSEVDGVSTVTTDNLYDLENGMLVELDNRVYSVSNITIVTYGEYTFDVTGTNITASSWQLALYYEYGRVLEINSTLKEQKQDPVNKNKRFPLMWLLTGYEENENFEVGYESSITLAFIYLSEQNLKAKKRVENKMEPILDPIYTRFKKIINQSPGSRYFELGFGERYNIVKSDKFKYGSIEGNKHLFDDITDAIELNMTLQFADEIDTCNYLLT